MKFFLMFGRRADIIILGGMLVGACPKYCYIVYKCILCLGIRLLIMQMHQLHSATYIGDWIWVNEQGCKTTTATTTLFSFLGGSSEMPTGKEM